MRNGLTAGLLALSACSPEAMSPGLLGALGPGEGLVREYTHVVSARLDHGSAALSVSRTFRNESAQFQSLSEGLALPNEAIATSFRVGVNGLWQRRPLLADADEAEAQWNLLRGEGAARPSTVGLLRWSDSGLDLDLFAVPPGGAVEVEYELTLPTQYRDGAWTFDYPLPTGSEPPQMLLGGAASANVEDVVDDVSSEAPQRTAMRIRQAWSPADVVEARWATSSLGAERTLWRLEIDAAAQLEPAPTQPHVVFVIDASHSQGPTGIAAQFELLSPYLANVPDAQVEVVLYRRFAQRLFGRFVSVPEVVPLLAATPAQRLEPGNGSNLEMGAALAAEALSHEAGPTRVVLMTDELLRENLSPEVVSKALASLPSDCVVHVVSRTAPVESDLGQVRDDGAPLSAVASARGGVFFRVSGRVGLGQADARTLLSLVRPTQIDSFEVLADGFEEGRIEVDDALPEGASVRKMALAAQPPARVTLVGRIWAREFRRTVTLDPMLAMRLPGLAVGNEAVRSELSLSELKQVALSAGAVSPVTSYLSTELDAAPSTVGLALEGHGVGMSSLCCCGCSGWGSTSCSFPGPNTGDHLARLRELMAPGVTACKSTGDLSRAVISVETTGDEVVAVEVSGLSTAERECLTEAAWALRLPASFVGHHRWNLGLVE